MLDEISARPSVTKNHHSAHDLDFYRNLPLDDGFGPFVGDSLKDTNMNTITRRALALLLLLAMVGPTYRAGAYGIYNASADTTTRPDLDQSAFVEECFADFLAGGEVIPTLTRLTDRLFELVRTAPLDNPGPFIELVGARHLLGQLAQAWPENPDKLREMLTWLRENPDLARTIAFTLQIGIDDMPRAYRLLDALRTTCPQQVLAYPNLTAALCAVRDKPFVQQVNENQIAPPDPVALFQFYTSHAGKMTYSIKNMPPALLMYVVDVAASIEELTWALETYQGTRDVGKLYHTIQYDKAHYRTGSPKQVTQRGYSLQNIKRFGGVCADQAYFASTVGKAIGVPTAYCTGRDSEIGHAWVGYFQTRGRKGRWSFDEGKFEQYQVVTGTLRNPKDGQVMPESFLAIQAKLLGTSARQRCGARAMIDSAWALAESIDKLDLFPEDRRNGPDKALQRSQALGPPIETYPSTRSWDLNTQLLLIQAGLKQASGEPYGWLMIANKARNGQLSLAQKTYWSKQLQATFGQNCPAFSLAVTLPMVLTIDDYQKQDDLLNELFSFYRRHHDLAAQIRIIQGQLARRAGRETKAAQYYHDVARRYVNSGPWAIVALRFIEQQLRQTGQDAKITQLYAQAWGNCKTPANAAPEFIQGSNWVRLGRDYARVLNQAGQEEKARKVLQHLSRYVTLPDHP